MLRVVRRLHWLAAGLIGFLLNVQLTGPASPHVKWFCAYDVAGQPEGLENVLCPLNVTGVLSELPLRAELDVPIEPYQKQIRGRTR